MSARASSIRWTAAAASAAALGLGGLFSVVAAPSTALAMPVDTTANATSSATGLVTCPLGAETATYSPGLHLTAPPSGVHLHSAGNLGVCVSTDLRHTGGSFVVDGDGPLTCVGGSSTGTGTATWANTGTHPSRFTYTGAVSVRPDGNSVLVLTGDITSGDYVGHTLVETKVIASTDLTACLTSEGLTTTSGPVSFTIV
ncbi:hypothetical protein NX794_30965 [Streptomyces sp. LP11]|uniref:Secreted protein n=1 Tax=Streptomyces pyxinicus TaxID=2970331 RepID=A0ABT2BAP8_9ACTN|nr:hypothetical protein [Streptomyces sp. LP11]MCS0605591.1 hypothetical protein [Streptomyces sp. LP11]